LTALRSDDAVGGRHGLGTKAKPLGACSIATAALLSELPNRTEMDSCTVGHSRRGGPSAPFVPLAVSPSWHEATTKPRPVPVGHFFCASANIRKIERAWQIAISLDYCGTATARIGFSS
jgi:hypothetical protein